MRIVVVVAVHRQFGDSLPASPINSRHELVIEGRRAIRGFRNLSGRLPDNRRNERHFECRFPLIGDAWHRSISRPSEIDWLNRVHKVPSLDFAPVSHTPPSIPPAAPTDPCAPWICPWSPTVDQVPDLPERLAGHGDFGHRKVTYRPSRATFAPTVTSFSRSVVDDQCFTSFGGRRISMKLAWPQAGGYS